MLSGGHCCRNNDPVGKRLACHSEDSSPWRRLGGRCCLSILQSNTRLHIAFWETCTKWWSWGKDERRALMEGARSRTRAWYWSRIRENWRSEWTGFCVWEKGCLTTEDISIAQYSEYESMTLRLSVESFALATAYRSSTQSRMWWTCCCYVQSELSVRFESKWWIFARMWSSECNMETDSSSKQSDALALQTCFRCASIGMTGRDR